MRPWRAPRAGFAASQQSCRAYSWRHTTCYAPRGGQEAPRQQRQRRQRGEGGERSTDVGSGGGFRAGGPPERQQQRQEQQEQDIPVVRPGQAASATFFSSDRWDALGASAEVVAALQTLGITRPSHIQAAAYRALAQSGARHVVLADHAGSGKTLAYLLPLLQVLREEERVLGAAATQPHCPRLVVVVPTAELCAQVVRVCRALSRAGLRFRSAAATGGRPLRTQKEMLEGGVDVLVGTPGRLAELLGEGCLQLTFCRAVVVDEVDVLLGEDFAFAEQVAPLRAAAPSTTRFVFATATIPEQVYLDLEEAFPGLAAALGPGLHRTAPGITEQLVDCSGGDEVSAESGFQRKAAALFAVLQEQRASRSIVFCNKIESCRKVENFLNRTFSHEDHAEVLPHHAAIADTHRDANLRRFLALPDSSGGRRGGSASTNTPERLVLVCTDRASRGMDSAFVEHVVLFDMPRDPSEYLRRVGRTTRGAGSSGVVSVLALGRQVRLAREIIDRNQGDLVLHRIPAVLPVAVERTDAERLRSNMAVSAAAGAMPAAAAPPPAADSFETEQHGTSS
ncbi:hypothetical protein CHLNCDRAFT_135879 [Chlorella variabilis]|uniref:DEAD-box ATP-dependent RNA helicase 50 n=1 Tax=Chlorella variabilis TaxID=554065 RepID=E1ZJ75_CHLVA|nr:hypothetical protein CHLNCDRAFT_135879 [Chlorella variabilis]EFN54452.1 hypothetical protein CHLNCDRAFT_135879 [Chlorella variabilis]|eukprot:XP_005846554.1 hypothetical protein CHLNCDRAFT_135879 [Chlorella variabilis]